MPDISQTKPNVSPSAFKTWSFTVCSLSSSHAGRVPLTARLPTSLQPRGRCVKVISFVQYPFFFPSQSNVENMALGQHIGTAEACSLMLLQLLRLAWGTGGLAAQNWCREISPPKGLAGSHWEVCLWNTAWERLGRRDVLFHRALWRKLHCFQCLDV